MNLMRRRDFLASSAALPLAAQSAKPNVLFIAVDDLNAGVGCYGAPVRTPHIDRLAAQGVRFERAYCQYPLCNPSRSSMLSGRRPPRTGILENATWFRDKMPDAVTLPQHFRQNGYRTMCAGKIFHGGLDDDKAWDIGGTKLNRQPPRTPEQTKEREKTADRWLALDSEEDTLDYRNASRAIELLNEKHDKPFFLALGFAKPHVPFLAPKKYFDMYPIERVATPPDFTPLPRTDHPAYRPNFDIFIRRPAGVDEARQMIAGYRAATSFMDAQLGRVLDALESSGRRRDTIVVFFGDHGFHLGEKGMWSKQTLFEVSTRVPLIISVPGTRNAGKPTAGTAELVDLYPTLAELCGLPAPKDIDGGSLVPLLEKPKAKWNQPAFTFIRRGSVMGASVRTARYRYTEWEGAAAELYDEQTDPRESRNIAADPRFARTVAEHSKLIAAAKVS